MLKSVFECESRVSALAQAGESTLEVLRAEVDPPPGIIQGMPAHCERHTALSNTARPLLIE